MPSGGAEARSQAMSELSVHIHGLMTQPQLADWFAEAESETLNIEQQPTLREMKRQLQQATVLPEALVKAQSLAGSKCEHAWNSQRKITIGLVLRKLGGSEKAFSRRNANSCRSNWENPYDVMLELYEPGTTTEQLNRVFSDV